MPVAAKGRSCHFLEVLTDVLDGFVGCLAYFCSALLHSHGFYLAVFLESFLEPDYRSCISPTAPLWPRKGSVMLLLFMGCTAL